MSKLIGFLIGFRKFIIILIFLVCMVLLRIHDLITSTDFAANLQLAIVAYFATNIGEHALESLKYWISKKDISNEKNS